MKKDAYFFPHFSNARHDRKVKRIIKELGVEGYGIYFMLLEVLREQTDLRYPLADIDLLADEFNTSEQKVRTVISNYKLFDVDECENFFSMKLVFYLQPYFEKTERARAAANKRWENTKLQQKNANVYANALPEHCDSIANAMQGEVGDIVDIVEVVEDNKEEELIETLWLLYPNKKGKADSIKKIPKLIKKYSFEEIKRCIERYTKDCIVNKTEQQFMKHGSTFFNSGYVDYLDENYEELKGGGSSGGKQGSYEIGGDKDPYKEFM